MRWEDVTLIKAADDVEFIWYSERETKTWTGANVSDTRHPAPKFIVTDSCEKDAVVLVKSIYREKTWEHEAIWRPEALRQIVAQVAMSA